MKETEFINSLKKEESIAHIRGWDFSHIAGRYTEETDLPWDYQRIIFDYLKPEMKLLNFCCPSITLTKIQVPQKRIRQTFSYAGKHCFLLELIFVQEMEKMRFLLMTLHLIW